MDQVTITDGEAVKAFIKAQDDARQQACAVFIASRAALRMATVAIRFFEFDDRARERDLTSVVIWRALLISGVASTMPTPDVRAAASSAFSAADFAYTAADIAAYTASPAVYTAARIASAAAHTAVRGGPYIAAAFSASNPAFWAEVTRDAALWLEHADPGDGTLSISIAPLWSDENPLDQDWHSLREKLRAADTPDKRGADWSFWIKWYDDILAGNPQNWKMLHQIATTPDIDWKASSREVNDKINGIVEAHALKNSYYFERIEFSEETQKLIVVPEGSFDDASVQTAYQRLRDAINEVRTAPKDGNFDPEYALRNEIRILEGALDNPAVQPIFVVEKCFNCIRRIQGNLNDGTIFGYDVEDFQTALERSAFDISSSDENAREIIERRNKENVLSLAKEDRDRLSRFVDEAAPILDADLKNDLETDLAIEGDPETLADGSTLRGVSRLLRIGIWLRNNKDDIQLAAALLGIASSVVGFILLLL